MNRIAIVLDGGIIQAVYVDQEVQVLVVDTDIEGCAFDDIVPIPALAGTDNPSGEYYLSGILADTDPALLDAIVAADQARFAEDEPCPF